MYKRQLRYNRDLAYLPLGAYAGQDAQNVSKMAKLFQVNSRKTNSAEHNALAAAYGFAIAPSLAAVVNAAPGGGPVATALAGATTATGTGPIAANKFADAIVGRKHGRPDAEGNKTKSGPTAYDEWLDATFGKVERKTDD